MARQLVASAFAIWVVALFPVEKSNALDPDVLLALPFDEGQGDTVRSITADGTEGSIIGDGDWVDGHAGSAVELNPDGGAVDYVTMDPGEESRYDLEITDSFTLAAWVNMVPKGGGDHFIIAKEENAANYRGPYLLVYGGASGQVGMLLTSSVANQLWVKGSTQVIDGEWHHIAGSHDGEVGGTPEAISIWVDGQPEELQIMRNDLNDGSILNNTPVTIGCRDVGGVPAKGAVDEAVIVKRVLTDDEVSRVVDDGIEDFLHVAPMGKAAVTWAALRASAGLR